MQLAIKQIQDLPAIHVHRVLGALGLKTQGQIQDGSLAVVPAETGLVGECHNPDSDETAGQIDESSTARDAHLLSKGETK